MDRRVLDRRVLDRRVLDRRVLARRIIQGGGRRATIRLLASPVGVRDHLGSGGVGSLPLLNAVCAGGAVIVDVGHRRNVVATTSTIDVDRRGVGSARR